MSLVKWRVLNLNRRISAIAFAIGVILALILFAAAALIGWNNGDPLWTPDFDRYFYNRKTLAHTFVKNNLPLLSNPSNLTEDAKAALLQKGITRIYEQGEGVVAFEQGCIGMGPSSVPYGFYYSPQDVPLWINNGYWADGGDMSGAIAARYLTYPMIREGDGWIPDRSALTDADPDMLKSRYYLYTTALEPHWYYFEAY